MKDGSVHGKDVVGGGDGTVDGGVDGGVDGDGGSGVGDSGSVSKFVLGTLLPSQCRRAKWVHQNAVQAMVMVAVMLVTAMTMVSSSSNIQHTIKSGSQILVGTLCKKNIATMIARGSHFRVRFGWTG